MKRLILSFDVCTLPRGTLVQLVKIGRQSVWYPKRRELKNTILILSKPESATENYYMKVVSTNCTEIEPGSKFYATNSLFRILPSYAQLYLQKSDKLSLRRRQTVYKLQNYDTILIGRKLRQYTGRIIHMDGTIEPNTTIRTKHQLLYVLKHDKTFKSIQCKIDDIWTDLV